MISDTKLLFTCSADNCNAKIRKGSQGDRCRLHSICSQDDCSSVPYAKGLCYNHYQKAYRGPTKSKTRLRCAADGCERDPWRGRRKLEDGKDWEVRFMYGDKQYCSIHRPQNVMPKEVFPKEYVEQWNIVKKYLKSLQSGISKPLLGYDANEKTPLWQKWHTSHASVTLVTQSDTASDSEQAKNVVKL